MTALVKRNVSVAFAADEQQPLCGQPTSNLSTANKQKQRDKRKSTKWFCNNRQMARLARPMLLLFFLLQATQHLPHVNMLTDDRSSSVNQLSFVESATKFVNNSRASDNVSVNSVSSTLSVDNEIVQSDVAATMLPATQQPAKRKLRRKYHAKTHNHTALGMAAGQRYKGNRRKVLLQRMQPNATHATRNMSVADAEQLPQLQRIIAENIPKNMRRQQTQQERRREGAVKQQQQHQQPQQQRLHQTQQQQQFSYNPREGKYHHQQQQQQQQQTLLPQSANRQRGPQHELQRHYNFVPQPDIPTTTLRVSTSIDHHHHQHITTNTTTTIRQHVQQEEPHQQQQQHHFVGNASSITSRQYQTHQQQPQPQQQQHTIYDTTTVQNRQDHVVLQGNTDIVVYRNIGTLPCPPNVRLVPHRFIPVHPQQRPRQRVVAAVTIDVGVGEVDACGFLGGTTYERARQLVCVPLQKGLLQHFLCLQDD
ncbi:putative mediator of RNA polymerase II transcription subunit 26 [Anastrepha obliqua]|uniref:putative mediator of RNA polymerase II transcription subunit 26 n=1 Tax=Anastrepha obliqua TaxID=95512 RepID=UPI002408F7B2|nr:putative mediator of RNA polymerase II transcription subunit 26 [Anastrepha obliqua]